MDIEDLLALLGAWLESQPTARGFGIEDAELRLRACGEGRLAVWLRPKNPQGELGAAGMFLVEKLEEVRARDKGELVESPEAPGIPPQRAFADFASLFALEQILTGEKEGQFYLDDEAAQTGDPLRD